MPIKTMGQLLKAARGWSTTKITFLGGEPSMHPQIDEAVRLVHSEGFHLRIVTNGHKSYARFLQKLDNPETFVCFSVDGSTAAVHDQIRGKDSFAILMDSIRRTQEKGVRTGAIVALCRDNAHDAIEILRLCDRLQFEYINVHYVTNRGFATARTVLSIEEWQQLYAKIEAAACTLRTELRVEKTFYPSSLGPLRCAVIDRSNLMFLPDGRVYMCMMFIDEPNSHSFSWLPDAALVRNPSLTSEQVIARPTLHGCPAIGLVNADIGIEVERQGAFVQCIYHKEVLGNATGVRHNENSPIVYSS
jgi:MoaA/NifB/PqqE/SkfB family radical SAM enzyme